jgi:hypothetical protein
MATTTGLVQSLSIFEGGFACVWIGPSPANVEILLIVHEASDPPQRLAFKTSMVDALSQALASRREVTVQHLDNDSRIDTLKLR